MTIASASQQPSAALPAAPRDGAIATALVELAPFVTVAIMAYPLLIWPLFEAQVVSLEPVYGLPAVDGPPSTLLRIYFSIMFALSLCCLGARISLRPPKLAWPPLLALAAYIGWAGMTGLWAVEPEISFRRFLLAVFIVGGLAASTIATTDIQRLLRIAFWTYAVMVLINTFSLMTTAPTALGHAGIYPHKNYFAAMTAMMLISATYQIGSGTRVTRTAAFAMLPFAVWFLIEARSKTCSALVVLVPLLSYAAVLLARYGRISPSISLPLFALALFGVYQFGALSGLWDFHAAAAAIFGDPSLTQRTDIWDFALKMVEQRPWLGYGYEVFWGAGSESPSVREAPGFVAQMPHAHNGYIDVLLQTGGIGLALLAVMVMITLHGVGRMATTQPGLAGLALSLLVFSLLYNCLESAWFRSFSLDSMVVVLAIVLASRREDHVR